MLAFSFQKLSRALDLTENMYTVHGNYIDLLDILALFYQLHRHLIIRFINYDIVIFHCTNILQCKMNKKTTKSEIMHALLQYFN